MIYSIWACNVSFSSSRTPKHLLEGTRETKLLSMEITLDNSPDLVIQIICWPNIKLSFERVELELTNNDPVQYLSYLISSYISGMYTNIEVRTVSTDRSFFPFDLWPKREARGP